MLVKEVTWICWHSPSQPWPFPPAGSEGKSKIEFNSKFSFSPSGKDGESKVKLISKFPSLPAGGKGQGWEGEKSTHGFTLIELLIALFIFTIVSMILASALHNIINTQTAAEKKSARFAELQTALLILSRDIEQAIDRPIIKANNEQENFVGDAHTVAFTRAGWSNPLGQLQRATLQHVGYQFDHSALVRITWPVLDRTDKTKSSKRILLNNVSNLVFEYIDFDNKTQPIWPPRDKQNVFLPHAVRVTLTLEKWGTLTQLFLIPGQPIEKPH